MPTRRGCASPCPSNITASGSVLSFAQASSTDGDSRNDIAHEPDLLDHFERRQVEHDDARVYRRVELVEADVGTRHRLDLLLQRRDAHALAQALLQLDRLARRQPPLV
jgi:hypothetical protein